MVMVNQDAYTEISEKKTSKLGYLVLAALFIFLITIGQTVFSDINGIPDRPNRPGFCVSLNNLESMSLIRACPFNEVDRQFQLDIQYQNIKYYLSRIVAFNVDISHKQAQIRDNERKIDVLLQEYDISLQEIIANEEALVDKQHIKDQIISLRNYNENLNHELNQVALDRDSIIENIEPQIQELKKSHEDALKYYSTQVAFYKFKIFLLKLLFVLPFFAFSLRFYLRYKKKDSPYTIIITSIFFASTILFLQVVLVFLYQILPMEWFARIFAFLMSSSILKYVVYYGSVILVIAILGGIVYYIQKKVYNPKSVAYRHLKENKCPNCGFNLALSDMFCPKCQRQIKTSCSNCKKLKYVDLTFCPHCGSKS